MNRATHPSTGKYLVATERAYDRTGKPIGCFVEAVEAYTKEELKSLFTPCAECGSYNSHRDYFIRTGQYNGDVEGYYKKCSQMEK